jgi:hypothetical protein
MIRVIERHSGWRSLDQHPHQEGTVIMSHQREERADYRSYLLRLWHTHSGDAPVWRATLEEPVTQQIWRFDDLPSLFGFLHAQTTQATPEGSGDWDPPPVPT